MRGLFSDLLSPLFNKKPGTEPGFKTMSMGRTPRVNDQTTESVPRLEALTPLRHRRG
jgi:hypothetical protein